MSPRIGAVSPSMCLSVALLSFLQAVIVSPMALSPKGAKQLDHHAPQPGGCAALKNHGTHFTVEIEVGTPGQKFDVVADTGSDAIIVPSCACVKAGYCNKDSRCFQGTNRSTSFAIASGPHGPPTIRMQFGSGPVQAVVASDVVLVGSLRTQMKDGILLMTDQLLNIKGQFEGILGLGLPSVDAKKGLYTQSDGSEAAAQSDVSTSSKGNPQYAQGQGRKEDPTYMQRADDIVQAKGLPTMNLSPSAFLGVVPKKASKKLAQPPGEVENSTNSSGLMVKGFMEEVGVSRFSMCFNDGADGVLRFGRDKVPHAHGSIGQVHWGLDFHGVSVGDVKMKVDFCTPNNMSKGQKTPCGAIPDSGTTAIMAPQDHIVALYESLCERWDRCKNNHTAMVKAAAGAHEAAIKAYNVDPFHIVPTPKAVIFQQLMLDCRDWLTKDKGLNELPPIHFHVGGANGTKQTLKLMGWSYVIETQEKEFKYIYKNVPGLGKMPIAKNFTGESRKVCSPAFGTMEYKTQENGPVWILGTPLFYEYEVGYDLSAKPPSISFSNTTCGSCTSAQKDVFSKKASFMSRSATTGREQMYARQPRQINGPLRMPNIDITKPL